MPVEDAPPAQRWRKQPHNCKRARISWHYCRKIANASDMSSNFGARWVLVSQVIKGFAAPESGSTYGRARELWEQLGSPTEYLRFPLGNRYTT